MPKIHRHEVVKFSRKHLDGIDWYERERLKLVGFEKAFETYESYPSWSLLCNDQFVAAFGVVVPYPGLGDAWCIASQLAVSDTFFFFRTVRQYIEEVSRGMKFRRLQALVQFDYEAGHRWARSLGFAHEATLRRYGVDGKHMAMYAQFPGGNA